MVNKCIICKVKEAKGKNGPFHRIPKDQELRKSWLKALNLTEVKEWDRICGLHFHSSDYWPHREKVQPLLKPKAVPFLSLYATAEEGFDRTDQDKNGTSEFDPSVDLERDYHINQMLEIKMHVDSRESDDHLTAGTSKRNDHNIFDEEIYDETMYEEQKCLELSLQTASEEIFQKKQHLQNMKIKSLEDSVRQLRTKMRKQGDRMKELERRLDESEYMRDMLKLV